MSAHLLLRHVRLFQHPEADSLLVSGERIAAVGRELDSPPGARICDLRGTFVTPGFNDAHIHFGRGAAQLSRDLREINLIGAHSPGEMQERIRARLEEFRPGEWITGRGWDHTLWPGAPWPTRKLLDEVSHRHPMYFSRVDMHVAVVNTAALEAAGLSAGADPPQGGSVDVEQGLLKETAMGLVRRVIPPPSRDARRAALERALDEACRLGLTSVQDNSTWEDYQLYRELDRDGRLTLRIAEWLDFNEPLETLEEKRRTAVTEAVRGLRGPQARAPRLKTGAVKGFADGSLGAHTAALLEPYADHPANTGQLRFDAAGIRPRLAALDAAGFQVALHAIGDAAVRACLDALEGIAGPGKRHRIEHAQVVAGSDIPRFARLGLIASIQPNHWLTDSRWAVARLGKERLKTAYPWRTLARLGVPLALGTDFPVEPLDPRRVLYAAVTRDGPERLTMEEALLAYTAGSAYAEFADTEKGSIATRQLADLVVWDTDLLQAEPEQVLKARVLMTVVGGEVIYECPAA